MERLRRGRRTDDSGEAELAYHENGDYEQTG